MLPSNWCDRKAFHELLLLTDGELERQTKSPKRSYQFRTIGKILRMHQQFQTVHSAIDSSDLLVTFNGKEQTAKFQPLCECDKGNYS